MPNIKLINASGTSTEYTDIDTLCMTKTDNKKCYYTYSYQMVGITVNLGEHCISSSTATEVASNGSYTTTLSFDDGYTLDACTVLVNNVDVTSTALSGKVITIDNPDGDIVITVSAKEFNGETWVINTSPTSSPLGDEAWTISQTVNVTYSCRGISGLTATSFSVVNADVTERGSNVITFIKCGTENIYNLGWQGPTPETQTVTFEEPASGTVLAWLQTNATKQE